MSVPVQMDLGSSAASASFLALLITTMARLRASPSVHFQISYHDLSFSLRSWFGSLAMATSSVEYMVSSRSSTFTHLWSVHTPPSNIPANHFPSLCLLFLLCRNWRAFTRPSTILVASPASVDRLPKQKQNQQKKKRGKPKKHTNKNPTKKKKKTRQTKPKSTKTTKQHFFTKRESHRKKS